MLSSRETIIKYTSDIIDTLYTRKNKVTVVANNIEESHAIPSSIILDYLTKRKGLDEASNFMLFCILDEIIRIQKFQNKLDKYFSKKEIETYSNLMYEDTPLKFPLEFNMIQIDNDQWIGSISAKELMKLRDSQVIWYNTNTQRTMTRIVKDEEEHWTITINKKAVKQIKDLLESNRYISNTITLNMPEDTEYSFDNNKLSIFSIDHFDIIDGYHRYLAISNAYNMDSNFDYQMELRITCYPQNKAKQFIFQNNEQTKMSKLKSDTFNQYKASNMVINRLNENNNCNLCGMINNTGMIEPAIMSSAIDLLYFRKDSDMKTVIKVTSELRKKLNELTETDADLLENRWSNEFIVATLICFKDNITDIDIINSVTNNIKSGSYNLNSLTTRQITRIRKECF